MMPLESSACMAMRWRLLGELMARSSGSGHAGRSPSGTNFNAVEGRLGGCAWSISPLIVLLVVLPPSPARFAICAQNTRQSRFGEKTPTHQVVACKRDRVVHVFTAITPMSGKLPTVFLLVACRFRKDKEGGVHQPEISGLLSGWPK